MLARFAAILTILAVPGVASTQMTRFQPMPRPAPRAPIPPEQVKNAPQLGHSDPQGAWFKTKMWCQSHADQNRGQRKTCARVGR